MKRTKFVILDWTGARMWPSKSFKTFDDAWEYVYEKFKHLEGEEFDEQIGEYSVEEIG